MKKLIPVLVCALLIVSLCTVFVSAKTTTLLLKDAAWKSIPQDGNECTFDASVEGKLTVSAPGSWPSIRCDYTVDQSITATVKDTSLKYDFTVEHGNTNISFLFAKDGALYEFPISNTALNLKEGGFETGSGDILTGHYSGTMKLSDLIESKTNFGSTAFDKDYVVDGKLTFAGLHIYATNGATVTIDALELVSAGEPAETSKETSSETSKTETSKTESSKTEATSSAAGTTSTANTSSTAPATSGTTPPTGDSSTGMIIALVVGALAIVAAGSVITAKVRH